MFISLIFNNENLNLSRLPQGQLEIQQRKILYMGLYLLIWGEAANVRFMPECLSYIFHNVRQFFIYLLFIFCVYMALFSPFDHCTTEFVNVFP